MKNQERVWKAEQQEAAEKRRLNELRREIDEERNREELKSIAKKSGIIPNDDGDDKKLEWMYKGPSQLVNREEYLLGRTIDKTFEELDAQEKAATSTFGVAQPKNHVEHECIPFSIRQHKDMLSTDQVDLARKLMEDPLMMIKQKQIESRQKILQNPVKLKELHRLLKRDESLQGTDKKKKKKDKKSKKSKKSKKKSKKGKKESGSSDSDSDSEGSADLDQLLAEKYKKVAGESQDGVPFDKLLTMKYQKLAKELDMMGSSNSKKKKHHRERSSSSASDSDRESRRRNDARREDRRRSPKQEVRHRKNNERRSSSSQEVKRRKGEFNDARRNEQPGGRSRQNVSGRERSRSRSRDKYRNKSPTHSRHRSPTRQDRSAKDKRNRSRSRSRSPARHTTRDKKRNSRSRSPQRKASTKETKEKVRQSRKPSTSSSGSDASAASSPVRPTAQDSDDERRIKKVRNFGLVSASGEKIELKSAHSGVRLYKPEEIRAEQSKQKPSWAKPTAPKRPLTEEEMEEKRLAMMSNAQWREKDRETNVKRYHEEDHREEAASTGRDYDKEFLTKQIKRAAASETVESRIRSNRNNIQRSNGAMDRNFAKR
ncbi:AGAP008760-PA-like protein [Anopheles sinensis]|uniref:AGAP008760-PA-like protein n=1 Tax=Anopheles sinensis TaxID=74873 RepID=A0A084VMP7_ANOSI|nr:AGAP008760-PA-like protein [Anopheles sinensis]